MWYEWAPWSLLCVASLMLFPIKRWQLPKLFLFFFIIIVTTFVMLSMISAKLQIYLLPVFPFLIYYLSYVLQEHSGDKWIRWSLAIPPILLSITLPFALVSLLSPHSFGQLGVQYAVYLQSPILLLALTSVSVLSLLSLYHILKRNNETTAIHLLSSGILCALFFTGFVIAQFIKS